MQKIITLRASQSDLKYAINQFNSFGWKVISITKGSELGRIGFSYKWTIVLKVDDNDYNADQKIESIIQEFSGKSWGKAGLLLIGTVVGVAIFVAILVGVLYKRYIW